MEGPIVESQSGFVRGVVEKHEEGFDYYAFRGIPYAEPPVGELRFKDPVPKNPWTGVLDCKNYGPMCLQHNCLFKIDCYNEDCLHLNVFTRSINDANASSPVIFVIHGGGFIANSADDFNHGPEYLIRKNVVLVLVNYRLGVLGFLNLEDEVAPGNAGLKDQLMGLQWVQRNIRRFGGDPENVTVMGLAAGGVAAHYLALSPLSKGLIHKVILQGGIIQNTWSVVYNPKSIAIKFCSILGKNSTDSAEIFQFLQATDAKALQGAQESLRQLMVYSRSFPFGPGRDDKSPNPIMPMDPVIAANRGTHLPCIVGCNSHEAILLLKDALSHPGMRLKEFLEMCDLDFGSILLYNLTDVLRKYNLTEAQVRRMYYRDEIISEDNTEIFVRLMTDLTSMVSIHEFARVQVEESSAATYLFLFGYDSPKAVSKMLLGNPPRGCGHLDEVPFFFKTHAFEKLGVKYFEKGETDYRVMERATEMWTNFARYGKPTVDLSELIPVHWTPVNDGTVLRYLNIDEDIAMRSTVSIEEKFSLAAKRG